MEIERLVYMANQIARNFAAQGEAKAVELTAQHIRDYWTSAMRAQLGTGRDKLHAIAAAALSRLDETA